MLTSPSTSKIGVAGDAPGTKATMTHHSGPSTHTRDPVPDHEQKRVALGYLQEAWAEARLDGIDGDCLAQACLFSAFAEFVTTYGEEAAAAFPEGLSAHLHIRNGEFSVDQQPASRRRHRRRFPFQVVPENSIAGKLQRVAIQVVIALEHPSSISAG